MKQLVFSIFSLILVVQVFLGTTGVIVYEHHCKKDGTTRSFFVAQSHERDVAKEPKSCHQSACCLVDELASKDVPFLKKEPCCTNSTAFIQMDSDLAVDNNGLDFDVTYISFDKVSDFICPNQTSLLSADYRGPPPLTTSHRLASLQTYLI